MRRLSEPTVPLRFDLFPTLDPEQRTNLYRIQRSFDCWRSYVATSNLRKNLLERPTVQLRLHDKKTKLPGKPVSGDLVLPSRVRWTTDFAYYRLAEGGRAVVYGIFFLRGSRIWVCAKPHAAKPADIRRGLSPKTRWAVLERSGRACSVCGATAADGAKLEVDHIRPVALGGTNELSNLQVLCKTCNIGKGAQYDGELL